MQKYEYYVQKMDMYTDSNISDYKSQLDVMGALHWELVQVNTHGMAIFKRPLVEGTSKALLDECPVAEDEVSEVIYGLKDEFKYMAESDAFRDMNSYFHKIDVRMNSMRENLMILKYAYMYRKECDGYKALYDKVATHFSHSMTLDSVNGFLKDLQP
jgi:hypothetical protein